MDIIGPNRFAAFFELNGLDYEICQSYTQLKSRIAETDNNIAKLKTKLHGLIMSRPVDIFVDNDDNGTVIDQVETEEQSIYSEMEELYRLKHGLETVLDAVDNAYFIISSNNRYEKLSKEEKYDLAFSNVVYNYKQVSDLKNPKYYLHKPGADKKYANIMYSLICNDRDICDIKDRVKDNIALYDYNDGRQLTAINGIFAPIYNNSDSNKAYIIYIKDNNGQKHIFVNKNGRWIFNTKDEAKNQLGDIQGVNTLNYCTYDYIKKHLNDMFSDTYCNSFFREFDYANKGNNVIKDIIINIFRLYYNKNTDTNYNEIIGLFEGDVLGGSESKMKYYTGYIIDKLKLFVSKFNTMTEDEFKDIMAEYYRTWCLPVTENKYEIEFDDNISKTDRLSKADEIIKSINDYNMLVIFVSAVIKHYLYQNVYEIKEIEF